MNLASHNPRAQGSALLAVLWLSAALAAISFSVAMSVRGETERVATTEEDARASYLAQGAIQRAILHIQWSAAPAAPGTEPYFTPGQPVMNLRFPLGDAAVEIIPESSKLSLNHATRESLFALLLNLGANPDQADSVSAGIVDWRSPEPSGQLTGFDQIYLAQQPSFRAPHASFQDVEELLYIPGMTPDLFYGTWVRESTPQASAGADVPPSRLTPREGLRDCVSVFGATDRFDANTVRPAVLAAVGVAPEDIQALVARRNAAPFLRQQELTDFAQGSSALLNRVTIASHTLYTLRASARLRRADGSFSDLTRVISALVKFLPPGATLPVGPNQGSFHILRWYDRG